jgi:coenzyme F420-dependent glucose-6-phosphate dehydrogenase
VEIGYALSSEEHPPDKLLRFAQQAENTGFSFALMTDHFHPWTDSQGQSPFVWSVLGAIGSQTKFRIGTGVTCPIIRTHPAIIAHAAATMEAMFPGRFILGLGTGENLNEHIVGLKWPPAGVRLAMLEEAIGIMQALWQGGMHSHYGRHFTLENARLYTLPPSPPPIWVSALGPKAARLAGQLGNGWISIEPDTDLMREFDQAGGQGKPRCGQVRVCWAESEEQAIETVKKYAPIAILKGATTQELPLPEHFEKATADARDDQITDAFVCGPDPEKHIAKLREWADAGFDHVFIQHAGPDQEGFFRFYEREVLPHVASLGSATGALAGSRA